VTRLEIADLPVDRLPGEVLLVPLFTDQRPLAGPAAVVDWRLDGAITQLLRDAAVTGKQGDCLGLQTNHKFLAPRLILVGGGRWQALDNARYQALIGRLLQVAERIGVHEVALCLPPSDLADASAVAEMVQSALAGTRRLTLCRLSRLTLLC
jgi:hypothetical protein